MIEWLFPTRCPVCMQPVLPKGAWIHVICEAQLPRLTEPVCMKCGRQLKEEEDEFCPECLVTDRVWEQGRSVYLYRGAAGRAIRMVKQAGTEEMVRFFGRQMAIAQRSFLSRIKAQCIVPVPLHKSKQRDRGFNQAKLLAGALGRETGLPIRNLLIKSKKTKEQKRLSREQRRNNVRDVYRINQRVLRDGLPESVLLLDDIVTTGSTLTACAKVLKEAGVKRVYFLTVCSGE